MRTWIRVKLDIGHLHLVLEQVHRFGAPLVLDHRVSCAVAPEQRQRSRLLRGHLRSNQPPSVSCAFISGYRIGNATHVGQLGRQRHIARERHDTSQLPFCRQTCAEGHHRALAEAAETNAACRHRWILVELGGNKVRECLDRLEDAWLVDAVLEGFREDVRRVQRRDAVFPSKHD